MPVETNPPHGGSLVNRVVAADRRDALRSRAVALPRVTLSRFQCSDLEMIAIGGFSPLTGFMGKADYDSVVDRMRLAVGLPWTIPIVLAVTEAPKGDEVALADESGRVLAVLHVQETFRRDKQREAQNVYRTTEDKHPGVANLYREADLCLAGPVDVIERPAHGDFEAYRLDPADTRRLFAERGWRTVVGFQTRNPVHRAHEYIQKCAMEMVDALLLHPLVGETKGDDIPADVRMRCYEALLENYYPKHRSALVVLPAAMRYAGPREAIFHAIMRKNYGCTHFIVGRDHAGVGSYYGPFDAQAIFSEFAPGELGITPLFFDNTFFCKACGNMASTKTCPHEPTNHVSLSGTAVRKMLADGQLPPPEFSRPEVARVLVEAMAKR